MIENIKLSFRGIVSHKLRSLLTMLGIIIGIAAIIAIVSTIQGTNEQIEKNLIGSGVNNIEIRLTQGDWEYDFSMGIPENLPVVSDSQLERLSDIENATSVSLYRKRQEYEGVFHGNEALNGGYVYGIDTSYFETKGMIVQKGRAITDKDIANYSKVCVLDTDSEAALFHGKSAIGMTVEIKGEPFVVVGVVLEKDNFEPEIKTIDEYYTYYAEEGSCIYIPTSVWPLIYQYDEPQNAVIRARRTEDMTAIGKAAEDILNESVVNENICKYRAQDLVKRARDLQQLSRSTNMMLLWIAGISLLVGGIGVMNIMLVSVTERTSEIGLKKAIGAPKRAILFQFLTEAVVLTSMGGILGIIIGIILSQVISKINEIPVAISWVSVVLAVGFSMVIGVVFGLLPSHKASNLDPIEALRHE